MPSLDDAGAGALRLWLVRHGRTLFNDLGLAQGWCDSPLTTDGIAAVEELASRLAGIAWTAVYSSPSERAMDTAELIVGNRYPIVRDRRWKEFNFGVWEARPNLDTFEALAALTAPGAEPFTTVRGVLAGDYPALEGGETGAEYRARVAAAMNELRGKHPSGDVLIVTHGMTVGVAATLVDADFDFGQGMDNATFSVIQYEAPGTATVLAYGARSPEELDAARV